jgi:hypothetical protein
MKKIVVIMSVAMSLLTVVSSNAQINISLGSNIGSQPVWGPVGYNHVDYYYLPDVESYYYVPTRKYTYLDNGRWISSTRLPSRYANYDIERGYKVVMNEPKPYLHFNNDKIKYVQYKGYKQPQNFIRNSNDPKYYVVKGHPKYNGNNKYGDKHDGKVGHENNGNGNKGKGNGNGKGKGKH